MFFSVQWIDEATCINRWQHLSVHVVDDVLTHLTHLLSVAAEAGQGSPASCILSVAMWFIQASVLSTLNFFSIIS